MPELLRRPRCGSAGGVPMVHASGGRFLQEQIMSTTKIIRLVAKEFEIKPSEIKGRTRPDYIAFPRQVAMTLAYEQRTIKSISRVAKEFDRTHGTVLIAVKQVA